MTLGRLICDHSSLHPPLGSGIKDGGFMVSDLERTSWLRRRRRREGGGWGGREGVGTARLEKEEPNKGEEKPDLLLPTRPPLRGRSSTDAPGLRAPSYHSYVCLPTPPPSTPPPLHPPRPPIMIIQSPSLAEFDFLCPRSHNSLRPTCKRAGLEPWVCGVSATLAGVWLREKNGRCYQNLPQQIGSAGQRWTD